MPVDFDFTVEYAKSNRSSCKACKDKIEKDQIRIGKMVQSPHFDGKIPLWHHVKCFFAKGTRGLDEWDMLHGRDGIKLDDQKIIKNYISPGSADAGASVPAKGKKRKGDDSAPAPAAKKAKLSKEEEENAALWKIKDALKEAGTRVVRALLEQNDQSTKGGESLLIDRCSQAMLFGCFPPCPSCGGTLKVSSGMYRCTSYQNEWAKCTFEAKTVELDEFVVPDELRVTPFLEKFKFKARKRVNLGEETKRANVAEGETGIVLQTAKSGSGLPLDGMTFAFAGRFSTTQAALKKDIKASGGAVSTTVNVGVTHLISTAEEVALGEESKKIGQALKFDIPILSETFVADSAASKTPLDQAKYLIGGSDAAQNAVKNPNGTPKAAESGEKKAKLVVKGRAAVDPDAGEKLVQTARVLDKGGDKLYDVTLNLADVSSGLNSFYLLQVIIGDSGSPCWLFRKWGRVGTSIGGNKLEQLPQSQAIAEFERLFYEKTGNHFGTQYVKKPGLFFPTEREDLTAGDDDPLANAKKAMTSQNVKSSLAKPVQDLVSTIFDIKMMEDSLLEMEIDLKKMPLGKLSKRRIDDGYKVLKGIEKVLEEASSDTDRKNALLTLTNQFYTYIPHDFGTQAPTLIDSMKVLKDKMKLMEALIDIEIATSLMKDDKSGGQVSVIDQHFAKLKTDMDVIGPSDDEFKMVNKYLQNQKGSYKLSIKHLFRVERDGERSRFDKKKSLGNRQLLWHGSRLTNYVGILSQGLRIAPPEAPKSGYRFGKGVYFADICEKSAMYCRSYGSNQMLMMLCDVAMGKQKELLKDKYMEKPMPGHNSTKAMGHQAPDPKDTVKGFLDGIDVPLGKPVKTGIQSYCSHNEYIIYDVSQVTIRYLLWLDLK